MSWRLKKYKKYIIGMAYDINSYTIDTYLVLKKDTINLVLYKWYEFSSSERREEIIKELEEEGYKPIEDFIQNKKDINKLIKKLR